MSISFNHPDNTVTSTDSLTLGVTGGTTSAPKTITFSSNSVIMPVRSLPNGQSGAVVFDSSSSTLKYHNGSSWVELLSKSDILSETNASIANLTAILQTKVDSVTYSTSSVPSAGISGTTLNIVFPTSSSAVTSSTGLFTNNLPGSIMYYALLSEQTADSVREQCAAGSQGTRTGTEANPYITNDGWCLADGSYWTWVGPSSTVLKQVPMLNNSSFLKSMALTGTTSVDSLTAATGTAGSTTISIPEHYHGIGEVQATSGSNADDAMFIYGKTWNDPNRTYYGIEITGDSQSRMTYTLSGSNTSTALSTTYNGSSSISHTHDLSAVEPANYTVAVLYNIAEQSTSLPKEVADDTYVFRAGDSMTGALNVLTPTENMHAATKLYVDTLVASSAKSYATYVAAKSMSFGTNTTLGTFTITSSTSSRAIRVSLPVITTQVASDGTEPDCVAYIYINGTAYVTNRVYIPNDKYGNGLAYYFTPMVTAILPAGTSSITIGVRVDQHGLQSLVCQAGYIWMDVI